MDVMQSNDGDALTLRLQRGELATLNNALNEILNGPDAIPEWEFHTRVGSQRSDALELLRAIHDALE